MPFNKDRNNRYRVVTLTTNPTLDAIAEIPQGSFPIEDDVLRVNFRYRIGGKGITCTRMLKSLGGNSQAIVLLGNDGISRCIEDYLTREEIDTLIMRTEGQGRICLILTEISGGEPANLNQRPTTGVDFRINGHGFPVDEGIMQTVLDTLKKNLQSAGALALAGSIPEGAPVDFYAQCIKEGRNLVPLVMLDSSGSALRHGIQARPHVVKINAKEAAGLMKTPVPEGQSETLLLARTIAASFGVEKVIITQGGAGAVAVDGDRFMFIKTPKIKARGALGAGDSFFAGLAFGLVNGEDFATSLRWGAACGASTAETNAGMIGTRPRVLKLFEQAAVTALTQGDIDTAWREASVAKSSTP